MTTLYIGLGGFIGTVLRYGVYLLFRTQTGFPWATLSVNVLGCFLIGCMYFWNQNQPAPSPYAVIITTGLLGGFTTFSAFGLETFQLIEQNQLGLAGTNTVSNVVLGVGAVFLARLLF